MVRLKIESERNKNTTGEAEIWFRMAHTHTIPKDPVLDWMNTGIGRRFILGCLLGSKTRYVCPCFLYLRAHSTNECVDVRARLLLFLHHHYILPPFVSEPSVHEMAHCERAGVIHSIVDVSRSISVPDLRKLALRSYFYSTRRHD